jgi:hypothetical protein
METIILTFEKHNTPKGNIFDSIISLETENNELIKKTNLINEATEKKHKEILNELIYNLNDKLRVIDFEFKYYEKGYYTLTYKNKHLQHNFSIKLNAISDKGYKYTTYTGKYDIVITQSNIRNIHGYDWFKCNDMEKLEAEILIQIKRNKGL